MAGKPKSSAATHRARKERQLDRGRDLGRDLDVNYLIAEAVLVAAIEGGVTLLVEAREIVPDFQAMIRAKLLADLDPWVERARSSPVASSANGVIKDKAAVCAAIIVDKPVI